MERAIGRGSLMRFVSMRSSFKSGESLTTGGMRLDALPYDGRSGLQGAAVFALAISV